MGKQTSKTKNWVQYYDKRNILDEITDESVDFILDERLRDEILSGTSCVHRSACNRHMLPGVYFKVAWNREG